LNEKVRMGCKKLSEEKTRKRKQRTMKPTIKKKRWGEIN